MTTAISAPTTARSARPSLSWQSFLYEHGLLLLFFTLLAIGLTWPMARDFTGSFPSDGGDASHNLWLIWHVREAMLGHQPLYSAPDLYYPVGISLLSHNPGPLVGFLAWPFWPGGVVAAHNGALLLGFILTGYFMYLLAREVSLGRGPALFAGIAYMACDMHLAATWGHIDKTFLGLIPLTLLMWLRTLKPERSPWWALGTAVGLLLALMHSGWQCVLTVLALLFFWLVAWFGRADERELILRRAMWGAVAVVVIVGPLLLAIVRVTSNAAIPVGRNVDSGQFAPDLVEFFLPRLTSRFLAQPAAFLAAHSINRSIETTVSLGWLPALLALVALRDRRARPWLLLTLVAMLFALGPALKLAGAERFTVFSLPIVLPYAFLSSLPGLEFMRTPGRFMLVGFVGLSISAGYGLQWLTGRWPRWSWGLVTAACALLLVEAWPQPWAQEQLPPTPAFYQELAKDSASYGVFDLPIVADPWPADPVGYAARYQIYQMTHRKGLAGGYLSRVYTRHPLFPCLMTDPPPEDLRVNGDSYDCRVDAQRDLAEAGFRYVVWHKARQGDARNLPGSYGEKMSRAFIAAAFGDTPPIIDDAQVTVYAVRPETLPPRDLGLTFADNWYERPAGATTRWAASPATLEVNSPVDQTVTLEIKPANMHVPAAKRGVGGTGVLNVRVGDGFSQDVPLKADTTARLAIPLKAGEQTIRLALQAGNFRPIDRDEGSLDRRLLSFDIQRINLKTTP